MVNFGPLAAEICWHVSGAPQKISMGFARSVQLFLHSSQQRVPVLDSGLPHGLPFFVQNCPFAWGSASLCNPCFLWLIQLSIPNGISIGSAVFFWAHDHDGQTNQHTDHAILYVAIGFIYVALLRGLKIECGLSMYVCMYPSGKGPA